MLVIHKGMLVWNRKPVLIVCISDAKFDYHRGNRKNEKTRHFVLKHNPLHYFLLFSTLQLVPASKWVELLLGYLLYPLSSWSFSQAEKNFYTSNSIKLKSKASFNDYFQYNPASSYGPLSWEQPNYQHKQHTFVGCRSTRFEWEQLQALPEHCAYLRCEHQARTPFLLLHSSLALSNRPCSETRRGIDADESKQASAPSLLGSAGASSLFWFILWLPEQYR